MKPRPGCGTRRSTCSWWNLSMRGLQMVRGQPGYAAGPGWPGLARHAVPQLAQARPQRPVGVPAVGQPGPPLEHVPRPEVTGQQPGHGRRGEVQGQHRQARAAGVLRRVPGLVRQQGRGPGQRGPVHPADDHVAHAEGGRDRHRQPVTVRDQQAVRASRQPGTARRRDQDPGGGGAVDQVGRQPDPVGGAHPVRVRRPARARRWALRGAGRCRYRRRRCSPPASPPGALLPPGALPLPYGPLAAGPPGPAGPGAAPSAGLPYG